MQSLVGELHKIFFAKTIIIKFKNNVNCKKNGLL